jgi:hypothetical protein
MATKDDKVHFRCAGCGDFVELEDIKTYGTSLCHEVARFDGDPMPCGPVKAIPPEQKVSE